MSTLEVKWYLILIYHLVIELKFSFPYWRVSSDAQGHQNDLLSLTNTHILAAFSVVSSYLPLLNGLILLSCGLQCRATNSILLTFLISEKARYDMQFHCFMGNSVLFGRKQQCCQTMK